MENETAQPDIEQNLDTPPANTDIFDNQLKARKRGRFGRGLGLLASVGAVTAGTAYFNYTPTGVRQAEAIKQGWHGIKTIIGAKENPDLIFKQANSDHVNILLIGRDVDYKEIFAKNGKNLWHTADPHSHARSDSMLVMSLDKTNQTIRMVSLPRDAIVHLPPNDFHVRKGKLNAAHAYGGPQLLEKTIHDELGISIDHYAVIKFDGFKKLIDDIGGITVNVDGALKRKNGKLYRGNLDYDDNWGNLHIHLKPGVQLLNGQQAHDFVRFREDLEGDPGRMRRQQIVMRSLAKKLGQLPKLQVLGLIGEIRRQFETDMNDPILTSAAFFAKGIGDPSKIQPLTLFGAYTTRGSFTLNGPKNKKLLAYVFGPTFNGEKFLAHSPSTTDDEIGPTNNASPGAKQILLAAGVIKDEKALEESPSMKLTPTAEDTRLAVAEDQSHSPIRPRRHRRTHHADDTSSSAASD